jgi:hypothetical protein
MKVRLLANMQFGELPLVELLVQINFKRERDHEES